MKFPFLLVCIEMVLSSIFFRMMVSELGSATLPIEPCAFVS